jgi:beta-galactosidase GanA
MLLCCPLLCFSAAEAGTKPLPGIVLAPGGHGFQTETGRPFVPFGVTYYRPGTGWAPQVWKQFDAAATQHDFRIMKEAGVNCVRVFLTFGSFLPEPGRLSEEGLRKFNTFLQLAEQEGIYVHPTGPDLWEGAPAWAAADRYADETMLRALENYWKEFITRYRGRKVIFAIDLLNEPAIAWDNATMKARWRTWVHSRYPNSEAMVQAWGEPASKFAYDDPPTPPPRNAPGSKWLLDYQHFREDLAQEWVRRQVMAIKSVDSKRLVTTGLVQWSVPNGP